MEKFLDKLSLHELLSMIIPGSIVILDITANFPIKIESTLYYPLFIIAAYTVGLAVDTIANMLFYPFRNHPLIISHFHPEEVVEKEIKCYAACNVFIAVMVIIYCAVPFVLPNITWSFFIVSTIFYVASCAIAYSCRNKKNHLELSKYYVRYYADEGNDTIHRLEGQVAFLRNIFFVLFVLQCLHYLSIIGGLDLKCFVYLRHYTTVMSSAFHIQMNTASLLMMTFVQDLTFILFVSMLARQNKIYYLIGVDFKFKQRSEDKVNVGDANTAITVQIAGQQ